MKYITPLIVGLCFIILGSVDMKRIHDRDKEIVDLRNEIIYHSWAAEPCRSASTNGNNSPGVIGDGNVVMGDPRVCGNIVDGNKVNDCPDDKKALPGGRNAPKP